MFGRGAGSRARIFGFASAVATLGAALVLVAGSASGDARPTIGGSPVVGQVLIANPAAPSFDGLYRWQSCNPAVASCSDSLNHNDPNWTDLPGPADLHENPTYAVVSSDLGHFIRLLTHDNSEGFGVWDTSPPVGPVTNPNAPVPITPEHGINVLGRAVAGTVRVKLPGDSGFKPLGNGVNKVPVNSVVDTRGSRIHVTAATGDFGNKTPDQSVDFYDGVFRITQSPTPNSAAVAQLVQKLACGTASKGKQAKASSGGPVAVSSGRRRRHVWGSGHGDYATSGGGGTGSVRGTTWLTQDTCKGTLFRVAEGLGITVNDFDLNKQVELGPGQSYFAKSR
jgi:hypothetical protein